MWLDELSFIHHLSQANFYKLDQVKVHAGKDIKKLAKHKHVFLFFFFASSACFLTGYWLVQSTWRSLKFSMMDLCIVVISKT